jgi:hypothetical protein
VDRDGRAAPFEPVRLVVFDKPGALRTPTGSIMGSSSDERRGVLVDSREADLE